jgi:hypothetical protein
LPIQIARSEKGPENLEEILVDLKRFISKKNLNSRFHATINIFFRDMADLLKSSFLCYYLKIQFQKEKLFQHSARTISCILIWFHQKKRETAINL